MSTKTTISKAEAADIVRWTAAVNRSGMIGAQFGSPVAEQSVQRLIALADEVTLATFNGTTVMHLWRSAYGTVSLYVRPNDQP